MINIGTSELANPLVVYERWALIQEACCPLDPGLSILQNYENVLLLIDFPSLGVLLHQHDGVRREDVVFGFRR